MNSEFWQARWQEKRIGFNQPKVNPLLIKHISSLQLPVGSRIFAPLCGKSIDMLWLAEQGYEVVGVELVELAVQDFFAEHNILPAITEHVSNPNVRCYQGQLSDNTSTRTISLWVGDIFVLSAADIGYVDAVYDRAALIAMPAEMRPKYCKQVRELSDNAPQLLLTLNYDQSERSGPPFSISSAQVQKYYGSHYQMTELEGEPSTLNTKPQIAVTEHIWLLKTYRESE